MKLITFLLACLVIIGMAGLYQQRELIDQTRNLTAVGHVLMTLGTQQVANQVYQRTMLQGNEHHE